MNLMTIFKNLFSKSNHENGLLEDYTNLLYENKSLRRSLSLIEQQYGIDMFHKNLAIGVLLSAHGGSLTVSPDLVDAVAATDFEVDYQVDKNNNMINITLIKKEPQFENDNEQ